MLATMGVSETTPSLLATAKEYVRRKYRKPGNVYLGVVSRLDAPVTGLVLLARTSKAAARLSEAFRLRQVEKTYLAVVEDSPSPSCGKLEHYLRKDERHRKMHVASAEHPQAQLARLEYRVLNSDWPMSLVEIALDTGRKHQIRVQLAFTGHPIVGDRKYGAKIPLADGIALHARRLSLLHPVRRDPLRLEAPLPPSWRRHPSIVKLLRTAE
ncbi:MAG: RNA pseudouridine synthase [Planctomycetota bacterium]|nr:MAG: RNA pseudouridine synthase [Planctomycetota bacterium]